MYRYERTYKTGRAVSSVLEIIGWVIVGVGIVTAIFGFSSGGPLGSVSRDFGGPEAPIILKVVSTLPGLITSAIGLFFIMSCQTTKAAMDSAEVSREMLVIARGGNSSKSAGEVSSSEVNSATTSSENEKFAVYRGIKIFADRNQVTVDNRKFFSVDAAKSYIDSKLDDEAI